MRIAFEGPDKTGKSTFAEDLIHGDGEVIYNISKSLYENLPKEHSGGVRTFDRIDWLSHMVYRLAMPGYEWNDAAVRTVFTMPDTHLVIKVHHESTVGTVSDELYNRGNLVRVNEAYETMAASIGRMNTTWNYTLFKSVTLMTVGHDMEAGTYRELGAQVLSHPSLSLNEVQPIEDGSESLLYLLQSMDAAL